MVFRSILALTCCLGWAASASAAQCAVNIGNGTADILISVTVRAEFAPPGSEADRNLSVKIGRKLFKGQTAKVEWDCPTNRIRYIASGLFSNSITRQSAPFTPEPDLRGRLDTAWIE